MKEYLLLKPAIESIPDMKVERPGIPVEDYINYAQRLTEWSKKDEKLLIKTGLPVGYYEQVFIRIEAYRRAEEILKEEKAKKKRLNQEWKAKLGAAHKTRMELLCLFALAFRKNKSAMAQLSKLLKHESDLDMILQLRTIAQLGYERKNYLGAIKFDLRNLKHAKSLARELKEILQKLNLQSSRCYTSKRMRDKAYTYLKQAIDEIRMYGKYISWDSPERLQGYLIKQNEPHWGKSILVNKTMKVEEAVP